MSVKDIMSYTDPDYPFKIYVSKAPIDMLFVNSPTSCWLRTKNYSYIVGGSYEGQIYRFKEHAHAMEFALRWL